MMEKKFSVGLVKAVAFISHLSPLFFDLLGNPHIDIHSNSVDVYFKTKNSIRNLDLFKFPCSSFRMYADSSDLIVIYTFNDDND